MIRDKRIGRRAISTRRITDMPTLYATGEVFNEKSNPAPTTFWLNEEFFVLLPVRFTRLKPEFIEELKAIAGIAPEVSNSEDGTATVVAKPDDPLPTNEDKSNVTAPQRRMVVIAGGKKKASNE